MNDAQIKAKLKSKLTGRYSVGQGLYFRVSNEGTGSWALRYIFNGDRREFSIGRYGRPPQGISLADARSKAAHINAGIKQGIDPIAEKNRPQNNEYKSVNDIIRIRQKSKIHKQKEIDEISKKVVVPVPMIENDNRKDENVEEEKKVDENKKEEESEKDERNRKKNDKKEVINEKINHKKKHR